MLIIFLVSHFKFKMSENSEKCPSQFPRVEDDIFKCLVLSDNSPKPQIIVFTILEENQKTGHIGEAGTQEIWHLLFKKRNQNY